jgi:hypothetical protein
MADTNLRPGDLQESNFQSEPGTFLMRKITFIILAALGLPFGLIWAQDQGPVQKTEKTVKKAASDTGETIKKGTKATARTVGKGVENAGKTIEKAGATPTNKRHRHPKPSPSASPRPSSTPLLFPALLRHRRQLRRRARKPIRADLVAPTFRSAPRLPNYLSPEVVYLRPGNSNRRKLAYWSRSF